jgi:hypothetical protein
LASPDAVFSFGWNDGGKFERAIKKMDGKKCDTLKERLSFRGFGSKIFRDASLELPYRTALLLSHLLFFVRWRERGEKHTPRGRGVELFFICSFFYFIACAYVGARADQIAISRSLSCNKASKHGLSEEGLVRAARK